MNESIESALHRGTSFLMAQQSEAGYFEGQLSSSTFPTCAYAWVQLAQNKLLDGTLVQWLLKNQNRNGTWGLDAGNQPNRDATLFAKLVLKHIATRAPTSEIEEAITRVPEYPLHLALIKLAYAAFGALDWSKLTISSNMLPAIRLAQKLSWLFPPLRILLKPPTNVLPPTDLFNTPTFGKLFIAEQHTLAAVFLIIELNTTGRPDIIDGLFSWLKSHVLTDGSWFRVNYITALSVLGLIELRKKEGRRSSELDRMIEQGLAWLDRTRNPDGGCREALNLNVWDTALSIISLIEIDASGYNNELQSAGRWLIENQNPDGGWAFSGLPGGDLPSDADDTALGSLALLKSKIPDTDTAIRGGLDWLCAHQGRDGSWSTYLPGQGDVGCVSITSHAVEAFIEATGKESEIDRACQWLKRRISAEGYWSDLWLAKYTYGTANAINALIKAGQRDCTEIRQGVRWLENVQNSDGGWGEDMLGKPSGSTVEQTAWCTYALLLANPQSEPARKGLKFLLDRQKADGSWEASCVGIYWEVIGGYSDSIYASVFPLIALNQARCITQDTSES